MPSFFFFTFIVRLFSMRVSQLKASYAVGRAPHWITQKVRKGYEFDAVLAYRASGFTDAILSRTLLQNVVEIRTS